MNEIDRYDCNLNHESIQEFYDYYRKQSLSEKNLQRIIAIEEIIVNKINGKNNSKILNVLDIGCGPGAMCIYWAKKGHNVHGLDINQPLLELATNRAREEKLEIDFKLGTATNLPWDDQSMDVCLVPELLEHVVDWRQCIDEFCRVLKPNGILFLSTNNKLCPRQQEFNLPLYSWYPGFIKRYCEKLALSTHPEIAGYATYPAVNWFTFFQLKKLLVTYGMESFDRFDLMDVTKNGFIIKNIIFCIRSINFLRWLAHIVTPYTIIVSIKNK